MKILGLLFTTILAISIHGKTNAQETPPKFGFSANFSPHLNYRQIFVPGKDKYESLSDSEKETYDSWQEIHQPILSFSGGFNFLWNFNKIYSLETGIQYATYGFKEGWTEFLIGWGPNTPEYIRSNNRYRHIEIPLKVNLGLNQQLFYFGIGLSPGFLLFYNGTNFSKFQDGSITKYRYSLNGKYFDRFTLAGNINIGFHLKPSQRLSIRIEPYYKHHFIRLFESETSIRFWSAGINFIGQFNFGA